MTAAPALPARPRYRPECPVLWRAPGQAQLGEGARHVLCAMEPDLAGWLLGLDGLRTLAQVLADVQARGLDQAAALRLLHLAVGAGAIDDAAAMPQSWRLLDLPARTAAQADHLAALLTYGDHRIAERLVDARQLLRVHLPDPSPPVGQTALPALLASAMTAAGFTLAADGAQADLTVLIGQHPVIGAEIAALEVVPPAGAHLFVAAYGDRAVAGPLVVPGRTSCLRCAYLHVRDADPHWTGVSMQLHTAVSRLAQAPVDRLLALLVSAQAARLARAWVDHPAQTDQWRDLAVELRLPSGAAAWEPRPAHPLCACRWIDEGDLTA